MLYLVRPDVRVESNVFDRASATGHLFNCQNGTLNLDTGQLRKHSSTDMLTKLAPFDYDSSATCPQWLKFLDRIMQGDKEMIAYLQRAVGYSLSGFTKDQVFFLCHGKPEAGKSTFLETIVGMMGEDYARTASTETFLYAQKSNMGEGARPDIVSLVGARMVSAVEMAEGRRLNENLLKALTGGDKIAARTLYSKEYLQFHPSFKIWLATNHLPQLTEDSRAFQRRLRLIKFNEAIPQSEMDLNLPKKLAGERAGIFNWALAGYRAWKEVSFQNRDMEPKGVALASAEYLDEENPIKRFVESEHCTLAPREFCPSARLYKKFIFFMESNGEKSEQWTQKRFSRALVDNGYATLFRISFGPDKGLMGMKGINLRGWEGNNPEGAEGGVEIAPNDQF